LDTNEVMQIPISAPEVYRQRDS